MVPRAAAGYAWQLMILNFLSPPYMQPLTDAIASIEETLDLSTLCIFMHVI